MTEHEYMRKWAEQGDSAIHSDIHALFKERDAARADYRALERQYTDLNALWMAKSKEADALRAELMGLADSAKRVVHTFEEDPDPQPMTDSQHFALKGLAHAIGAARRTLGGD